MLLCNTSSFNSETISFKKNSSSKHIMSEKIDYIWKAFEWYKKARDYVQQLNKFRSLETDLTNIFYGIQIISGLFLSILFIRFVISDTYESFNFVKKLFITGLLITIGIPLDILISNFLQQYPNGLAYTILYRYAKSERYQKKFEEFKTFLKNSANQVLSKASVS